MVDCCSTEWLTSSSRVLFDYGWTAVPLSDSLHHQGFCLIVVLLSDSLHHQGFYLIVVRLLFHWVTHFIIKGSIWLWLTAVLLSDSLHHQGFYLIVVDCCSTEWLTSSSRVLFDCGRLLFYWVTHFIIKGSIWLWSTAVLLSDSLHHQGLYLIMVGLLFYWVTHFIIKGYIWLWLDCFSTEWLTSSSRVLFDCGRLLFYWVTHFIIKGSIWLWSDCCSTEWLTSSSRVLFDCGRLLFHWVTHFIIKGSIWLWSTAVPLSDSLHHQGFYLIVVDCCSTEWLTSSSRVLFDYGRLLFYWVTHFIIKGSIWLWSDCCSTEWLTSSSRVLFDCGRLLFYWVTHFIIKGSIWLWSTAVLLSDSLHHQGLYLIMVGLLFHWVTHFIIKGSIWLWSECCSTEWLTSSSRVLFDCGQTAVPLSDSLHHQGFYLIVVRLLFYWVTHFIIKGSIWLWSTAVLLSDSLHHQGFYLIVVGLLFHWVTHFIIKGYIWLWLDCCSTEWLTSSSRVLFDCGQTAVPLSDSLHHQGFYLIVVRLLFHWVTHFIIKGSIWLWSDCCSTQWLTSSSRVLFDCCQTAVPLSDSLHHQGFYLIVVRLLFHWVTHFIIKGSIWLWLDCCSTEWLTSSSRVIFDCWQTAVPLSDSLHHQGFCLIVVDCCSTEWLTPSSRVLFDCGWTAVPLSDSLHHQGFYLIVVRLLFHWVTHFIIKGSIWLWLDCCSTEWLTSSSRVLFDYGQTAVLLSDSLHHQGFYLIMVDCCSTEWLTSSSRVIFDCCQTAVLQSDSLHHQGFYLIVVDCCSTQWLTSSSRVLFDCGWTAVLLSDSLHHQGFYLIVVDCCSTQWLTSSSRVLFDCGWTAVLLSDSLHHQGFCLIMVGCCSTQWLTSSSRVLFDYGWTAVPLSDSLHHQGFYLIVVGLLVYWVTHFIIKGSIWLWLDCCSNEWLTPSSRVLFDCGWTAVLLSDSLHHQGFYLIVVELLFYWVTHFIIKGSIWLWSDCCSTEWLTSSSRVLFDCGWTAVLLSDSLHHQGFYLIVVGLLFYWVTHFIIKGSIWLWLDCCSTEWLTSSSRVLFDCGWTAVLLSDSLHHQGFYLIVVRLLYYWVTHFICRSKNVDNIDILKLTLLIPPSKSKITK